MSFGGYDAFEDPYCYKGTTCLKNRLGIRDPVRLENFELEMSSLRAGEPLPDGRFRAAHYRNVHLHLFQDVYRWAGRYRSVRTSKGGNPFCYPEHIRSQMNGLFARLQQPEFLPNSDVDESVNAMSAFLADLNAIHPFREGNGRAQLAFLHLVALRAGHPMKLRLVKQETFLPAMIASYHGDLGPLEAELAGLVA